MGNINSKVEQAPTPQMQILKLVLATISVGVSVYGIVEMGKSMATHFDVGMNQEIADGERARKAILARTGKDMILSKTESALFRDVILPEDIKVTFEDIGGMTEMKNRIFKEVIMPLSHSHLFKKQQDNKSNNNDNTNDFDNEFDELLTPPRGALFMGPPGTGKSMTAMAIAKDCGCTFISVRSSTMLNMYVGESNKKVRAIFSLAKKLAPTILFIDEIDILLPKRSSFMPGNNDKNFMGEFMILWEDLNSCSELVVVIGATNLPNDLDEAILRRMPARYLFRVPQTIEQREHILSLMMKGRKMADDLSLAFVAECTPNYTGSDLRQVCKMALMRPVHDAIHESVSSTGINQNKEGKQQQNMVELRSELVELKSVHHSVRPVCLNDFLEVLKTVKPAKQAQRTLKSMENDYID